MSYGVHHVTQTMLYSKKKDFSDTRFNDSYNDCAGTSSVPIVDGFEETLEQFMGILGEGSSLLQARRLLLLAGGDLQHALNLYCDRPPPASEHHAYNVYLVLPPVQLLKHLYIS